MKAIPNTLFAFFLLVTGLSACGKNAAQMPAKLSIAEIEILFKECAPVNGGPVYSIHHDILLSFTERLKEAPDTSEATKNFYAGVKTGALDKLGAELPACMKWHPADAINERICNHFIECQKEIFPYTEEVKSDHMLDYDGNEIESLLKSCASRNGGPIYPVHQHITRIMTKQLGGRPDSLEALDEIYPKLRDQAFDKLTTEVAACMNSQYPTPITDKLCNRFIECQKEIFPYGRE